MMQIHPLMPALPNSMKATPKLPKACKTLIILLRFIATVQERDTSTSYNQIRKKRNFFSKDKQVHSKGRKLVIHLKCYARRN